MQYGTIDEILTKVEEQSRLHHALCILKKLDTKTLHTGRNEILGDELYINCMEYQTEEAEKKIWEAHKVYYDVHCVLGGEELVQISPRSQMIGKDSYNSEGDYQFFDGESQNCVVLKPGLVLICGKDDVHKGGIISKERKNIRKMVMKVGTKEATF